MDQKKPYYFSYEARYQKVYAAGANQWGHSPHDEKLIKVLSDWVEKHHLRGKKILEFACGEGASGVILSQLGCLYYGIDIAPSAIKKAETALAPYPTATVSILDMVQNPLEAEAYDGALDVMGLHMLITDSDRKKYLHNVYQALKPQAPMLFYQESYWADEPATPIHSLDEWANLTGGDYETPQPRTIMGTKNHTEVLLPILPARGRSKDGYLKEMRENGFAVDDFFGIDMPDSHLATIYVHKL